jgi:hypothetical protein
MGGRGAGCAHPCEKSALGFETQAYIAYLFGRLVFEGSVLLCSENALRNVCRNAWETIVL